MAMLYPFPTIEAASGPAPAIDLYTDSSPNGFKITIALEELQLPYRLHHVEIDKQAHRTPEFLRLNPHGRIPVLVDHDTGVCLFESAAILLYLADKTQRLLSQEPVQRWKAIQWLIFHAASVGPLLGQRVHFEIFASEPNTSAIERYQQLSHQAFLTLDQQLSQQPFLGGSDYSIADIAQFGWSHIAQVINMDLSAYTHLTAWHQRIAARPAVQRGIALPTPATGA